MQILTSSNSQGDSVRPVNETGLVIGRSQVARNQKRGGSIWAFETAD